MTFRRLGIGLALLLLLDFQEKRSVDVGKDATKCDGSSDQGVQLFITANCQLQMTRSDALDLEIFGGVAGKFEDFGREVFEDGSNIDGGYGEGVSNLPQGSKNGISILTLGTNSHFVLGVVLQEALDTTAGELVKPC